MRVLTALIAGFPAGGLLLGAGVEWFLDRTAGPCTAGCPAYRDWLIATAMVAGWLAASWGIHALWERISPEPARSAYEEQIRRLRRGGR